MKQALALALALGVLGSALGCTPRYGVLRVEDGGYVVGQAYEAETYSDVLAGVLAEGDGKYAEAAASYQRARAGAGGDPEVATRLYHASCWAAGPGAFDEKRAREDVLEDALQRGYAPAYAALADCVTRQGTRGDAEQRRRANAGLARTSRDPADVARGAAPDAQLELRLSVLLTAHPESREAQLALAQCLERLGKRAAAAETFAIYARNQPSARKDMLRKAEAVAARGDVYGARRIAGAALDAPSLEGAPLGELPALGARLGLDEALARGDERATLRRASRARLPLGEVAARAMLAGERVLAERLARAVLEAGVGPVDADAAAVLLSLGEAVPEHVAGTPSDAGRKLVLRALPIAASLAR